MCVCFLFHHYHNVGSHQFLSELGHFYFPLKHFIFSPEMRHLSPSVIHLNIRWRPYSLLILIWYDFKTILQPSSTYCSFWLDHPLFSKTLCLVSSYLDTTWHSSPSLKKYSWVRCASSILKKSISDSLFH